jgi:hypothetical protein
VREGGVRTEFAYKIKPDIFDGTVPLLEFFTQFDLIARANQWDDMTKTVVLVSSLRGKARSVLESVQNFENLEYAELKAKLELRFGEVHSLQNYYSQFTNRKQKFGEDLASLGTDLERLSQLAYPECSFAVRDKIACAQFISALTDGFVKKTLQLEGVTSLRSAVERAKAVKIIHGEGFQRRAGGNYDKRPELGQRKIFNNGEEKKDGGDVRKGDGREKKYVPTQKECWLCGKVGHFRFECPSKEGNEA